MEAKNCTNYDTCRLVNATEYKIEVLKKDVYIKDFCIAGIENWTSCKRYLTKSELNFCPDFVLPDTQLSPTEIVDKFDEDHNLQ